MKNGRFRMTKGILIGTLTTLLLSGTVLMANTQMREVVFGVSVSLNGQRVNFDADSQPFTMESRTFLPVRAIADMVGLEVDFDGATNTVLLTGDGAAAATPARATSPTPLTQSFFNSSQMAAQALGTIGAAHLSDGTGFVRTQNSVIMDGQTFNNAIAFRSDRHDPAIGMYSSHRLDGRYTTFVGTVGRIDGSGNPSGALWRIWADGVVVYQFDHSMTDGRNIIVDPPKTVEVDVTGVNVLTIEVTVWSHQTRAEFAIAGETRP